MYVCVCVYKVPLHSSPNAAFRLYTYICICIFLSVRVCVCVRLHLIFVCICLYVGVLVESALLCRRYSHPPAPCSNCKHYKSCVRCGLVLCVYIYVCVGVAMRTWVCVCSSFIYTYTVNGVLARSWQHAHRCRFVFGSWQRVDPITVQRVTRIHRLTHTHTRVYIQMKHEWKPAWQAAAVGIILACVCVLLCWCKHKISADVTTHICMMCIIICANYLNKIVILHQQQWLSLRLSDSA